DLLFMPSFNELFPMAILEAVNTEKPLLLRDLELYEDILFHKYFKASDIEGFTDKIRMLRADKDMMSKGAKTSKEISDYYSKENVAKIWRAFYTEIYNKKAKTTVNE
ncbi:MAG: glycosyltransferase, partial [Bacilli bacterium]|nr:glycosyltransferase [Bacilli bacterium]